jgi:hypothetical protein
MIEHLAVGSFLISVLFTRKAAAVSLMNDQKTGKPLQW